MRKSTFGRFLFLQILIIIFELKDGKMERVSRNYKSAAFCNSFFFRMSDSESVVVKVVADVMLYEGQMQRWVSVSSPGPSDVYILLNAEKQQYRIVGRKGDSGELTINCGIISSLVYNEATPKFHQWRANGQV